MGFIYIILISFTWLYRYLSIILLTSTTSESFVVEHMIPCFVGFANPWKMIYISTFTFTFTFTSTLHLHLYLHLHMNTPTPPLLTCPSMSQSRFYENSRRWLSASPRLGSKPRWINLSLLFCTFLIFTALVSVGLNLHTTQNKRERKPHRPSPMMCMFPARTRLPSWSSFPFLWYTFLWNPLFDPDIAATRSYLAYYTLYEVVLKYWRFCCYCHRRWTMVYGGKPSTGCYLCRKRKIKVSLFLVSLTVYIHDVFGVTEGISFIFTHVWKGLEGSMLSSMVQVRWSSSRVQKLHYLRPPLSGVSAWCSLPQWDEEGWAVGEKWQYCYCQFQQ